MKSQFLAILIIFGDFRDFFDFFRLFSGFFVFFLKAFFEISAANLPIPKKFIFFDFSTKTDLFKKVSKLDPVF